LFVAAGVLLVGGLEAGAMALQLACFFFSSSSGR